jgi:hypothetical protein
MADKPRDKFEQYFAEKLWEMIPSVYRHEDGIAENPGVLRALVEVLAEQAAILRRSHDRLWDDQFIELCDDWAVPYLADLVGTRLVSALNRRGRRVDVAKTIYYRRRKGTLRVLEELIGDIAGWEGVVVESFRRLGRARHRLDPHPGLQAGHLSGTLPGGWADLRRPQAAELTGGPFDEFYHTPDTRQHRGVDGRYGIPRLAFHLYRLRAFRVEGVTPHARSGGLSFTCDPSGRDVPLFMPRNRPQDANPVLKRPKDWDAWRPAREWELPAPMTCRLLARAKKALIPDALSVEEVPGATVPNPMVVAGNLETWTANAPGKRLVVDPERGRLLFLGTPPAAGSTATYHYGFSGEIGAGTYDRREVEARKPRFTHAGGGAIAAGSIDNNGVTQIEDSATYGPIGNKLAVEKLTLQAANQERPYVQLQSNWVLNTGSNEDAELLLDGLWLGGAGKFAVVLRGDYERVTIRSCTFDPGGTDAGGDPIPPLLLVIEAQVEELVIEESIMAPIRTQAGGVVEKLIVRDSILQSVGIPAALELPGGEVVLERVTVFGSVDINRLWASEALITGSVDVTNTQDGCFRFSAAPQGSRLPHPYESHLITDSGHFFTSRHFGHPGYAQLSETAPVELRRGAESGSEIGAFSALLNPIKLDSLRAKVDEYMPFGLIPVFILET